MKKIEQTLRNFAVANDLEHLIDELIVTNKITPDTIGPYSTGKVDWICKFGHKEHESPFNRTRRGYCSICGRNRNGSLAQNYPDLVKLWSPENHKQPEQVPPTYTPLVEWKCSKGHTWKRTIKIQLEQDNCPICHQQEKSLFSICPELEKHWDEEKNGNIDRKTVAPFSSHKYYWKCEHGHSYMAAPEKLMRKAARCPICNSFGFNRPDIIDEWHPTKNGDKTPFDFSVNSQKSAWFICAKCHNEYESRIAYRAKRISPNCPICKSNKRDVKKHSSTYENHG